MDSFRNLEEETFPSFFSNTSLGSDGRATLGDVTLGSTLGVPMAASTVAKSRATADNRLTDVQASYLEPGLVFQAGSQGSGCGREKFALSFKDDLDNVDDFIAANRFSDLLVKVNLDESESVSTSKAAVEVGAPSASARPSDYPDDISTGLLTVSHIGGKETIVGQAVLAPIPIEEGPESDAVDSDGMSGSVSSFLANEKLMSLDSMNSDITDDDIDVDNLHDEELQLYFNKLIPTAMQRGRVEGQEIPAAELPDNQVGSSQPLVTEPDTSPQNRCNFLNDYDKGDFCMPDVRLAATGMDSCPASDEDTEDELEASQNRSRTRFLLPSTSRHLVGESHQPHFRPGLVGGSSDDESQTGAQFTDSRTGIEHRCSAEGQVIDLPITGDGGGGDGSSGSEEDGNDGGVATVLPPTGVQTTYDVLRGLGIVGGSGTGEDEHQLLSQLPGLGRFVSNVHSQMGDRVGPVGTVETDSSVQSSGQTRLQFINQSMNQDRQEALNAMDSSYSGATSLEERFDSIYLRPGGVCNLQDSTSGASALQGTQNAFEFSFTKNPLGETKAGVNKGHTIDFGDLGLRGGLCRNSVSLGQHPHSSEEHPGESVEVKYLSQNVHQNEVEQSNIWNEGSRPDDVELEFQQGANATHSVVYQNEDGKWVTDLAYYSSFEKETNVPDDIANQLQSEEFVGGGQAMEKIIVDQEEFEKEHQFMQEEQIEAVNRTVLLGDTSWKLPASSHILMRASQVSTEFEKENQSYLRISLGEFFQQRSEALGCLGSREEDIKRPSFGYIINSPEKREPFALIRPSDFSSRGSSVRSETVQLSDADETMNPEDLEKTLEPTPAEQPRKGHADPKDVQISPVLSLDHKGNSSQSSESNSSGSLTLSISTIASAIADASISSDPAQLAAMIMELSKKRHSKSRRTDELVQTPHPKKLLQQDDLQKSLSLGDLSALDMEKYLKKAEVSSSDSDASSSHSCLDILSLADSLANSCRSTERQTPLPNSISLHAEEHSTPKDIVKKSLVSPNNSSKQSTEVVSEVKRSDAKRSYIPRPKTSCIPTPTAHPPRRSAGAGQSLTSTNIKTKPVQGKSERNKNDCHIPTPAGNRSCSESRVEMSTARPEVSGTCHSLKSNDPISDSMAAPKNTQTGGCLELPMQRSPPHTPKSKNYMKQNGTSCSEQAQSVRSPQATQTVGKEKQTLAAQSSFPTTNAQFASPELCTSGVVEASHCTFRPSTSPLTHSSPSQTSLPSGYGDLSPSSSSGMCERSPGTDPLSPQSHCSSPSMSRLTYLSINENTTLPTPNHHQKNNSMSLSTTIIRASPTPPMEPVDANKPIHQTHNGDLSSRSSCPSTNPGSNQQTSEHGSHIQNERHIHKDCRHECQPVNRQSESHPSLFARVDSGYSSNLNINNQPAGPMEQNTNKVPDFPGAGSEAFLGSQYLPPPTTYKSEPLRYGLAPNYNSQGALSDLTCGIPTILTGRSLFSTQLPQQYLGAEGSLQASSYHIGPLAGPYGVPAVMTGANSQIANTHVPGSTGLPSVYMTAGQHPHQYPLSKPYGQPSMTAWSARDLADLRTQVVVPDELKFPGACCVGIACQTSLSIFNPSERWQQVAISIVNLSIDGVKVDSLPYQWLIVKNKTIIGPKSTEEQKVLLIAPKAGLYQCTLSVSSWPASAESETVAQAEAFAKKVVLIAVAENPAIEVDVGKTGCLDFGDLAGGSVKSLPLKMVNRTRATVPIRLVISANASAWHCFSFSKSPVTMTADGSLHSGGNLTSISVINHVMHSSCGDNPDSFMVWVHFTAPQRFSAKLGELGPPDEFTARVDIEVDNPGPSHVIQSVALRARSGTARVHAPKDLQTVCLQTPLGQSASQTLPLKNAGNIDVQLRLKCNEGDNCFMVKPEELLLRTGEEQGIVVTFTAQSNRKYKECLLTIFVLPSGPQYEVVLKGEVVQGNSRNVTSAQVLVPNGEVPPILSNKQFMAWGGVTLGRAVQQKLILRNNSPTTSQQLRILIRGQDQDCFQLQSSFGPDERLTRSRELLIKPKEDVAVHLLFAPTRVASMLAKLEIKQSAVRPSQPGVKFTIPLSGYGGTSNVILEELRKRSDGYVATLSGIQKGRVSKLCVCVRNTGSRAAFIRAVPYSDVEKRTVMDSTIISLSPSQFILKERTQEVITVVMKASCREQALCQTHTALLATICLFCGDEVSRQQFRKLLRIKPDVGKKVLSENSLLKSISFDEPFLGEELVQEACDLPQRPNEAQVFYGNMSKVILSLLGTVETSALAASDHIEFVRASQHHAMDSDSGLGTSERHFSNVSLDVLPVKGPPLCASEPVLKRTESSVDNTWSVQPEQLVLSAPTITGVADTKHVRILNCSDCELRFELSWPAHCLTITPQHGIIEPQSNLQILISPNPSLATKTSMLPWSGQIYVQCDNQQKFIRVQIRQDLAMDISAAGSSSDHSLCPLPPQAETPVGSGLKAQCSSPQTSVEIKNRTVVFPSTCSGESSECSVEVENHGEEVRWYLSSFAPPYVKGVDGSGDVYRATYTAFRCERMSGMLGVKEKMQVPFTFLPRDGGDYAQFWDLECHPVTKPQQKSRIRFQLCGMGIRAGAGTSRKEDCALVRTDVNVKSRTRVESAGSKTGTEPSRRGVYAPQSLYMFPATRVGEVSTLKVNFRNNSCDTHELRFLSPSEPFYIRHSKYSLRTQHYINLPVQFKPTAIGLFTGLLLVQTDTDVRLAIELSGEALL
ncbi:centrosomal protein of 192 kDa isoform X1 [Ictalurus punctatus]|uniref:Centrosomal protein of 192 kDa isoform X1 n=1 Tax=Ictalurus punctatus TaxID=7998 RepID=A0A2D0RIP0_ICTPU|nr:centrosomal protein of 192 kDa isoform X1 [Ictalurus punctatus]XP_017329793.2 centrosomal protein of 192 kDa isoform X1 [Ictalurus punctatus]